MIFRIHATGGFSFKGAAAYITHDLEADTAERVRFTHCANLETQDPEKAWKVMAWTASHWEELRRVTGGHVTKTPTTGSVYTMSISWGAHENPSDGEMLSFAQKTISALGADDHEAIIVGHRDTENPHVHVMINRVHPETGYWWRGSFSKTKLQSLGLHYERDQGVILCPEREANAKTRAFEQAKARRGEERAYVGYDEPERKMHTPEYQAKRRARIEAQKKAGALTQEREQKAARQAEKSRDLHAAFDQASPDAERYRAKDIRRDPKDEQEAARAAWEDERRRERQRQRETKRKESDERAFAKHDLERREWVDARRAENWSEYEAGQWVSLDEKQMQRREGLRDQQLEARALFQRRQDSRFAQSERAVTNRITAIEADMKRAGVMGMLDRLTGREAHKVEQLAAAREALAHHEAQRRAELEAFEARQAAQREAQRQRQEQERTRKAEQLAALKARRDAEFEQREREKAPERRAKWEADRSKRIEDARIAAEQAQKQDAEVTRKDAQEREQRAREAEREREPGNDNQPAQGQQQGRGLDR